MARLPARTPCSAHSGRTAQASADRRTGRPRWDRPYTVPGQTALDRRDRAPTAQVLDPAPADRGAARLRTGPGRSPLAQAKGLAARILAGLAAATVAPDPALRPVPARGPVPAQRLPSRARTGQPTAAAPPRTAPGRLDQHRAVPAPTTPDRAGSPAPALAGRVPGRGSLVPGTPGPAGSPDVPDTPGDPGPAVRRSGRRARPVPDLAHRHTAQGRAGRRGLKAAGRAAEQGAAAQGQVPQDGDAGPRDVAEDGLRPASRLRDDARAGPPMRGRMPSAS